MVSSLRMLDAGGRWSAGSHGCSELWELAGTKAALCSLESSVPQVQADLRSSQGQVWGQSSAHPNVYVDRQTPPHTHTYTHDQNEWCICAGYTYFLVSLVTLIPVMYSSIPTALGCCFLWASSNAHAERLLASPSDMPRRIWILAQSPAWAQAGTSLHSPSMLN